MTGTAGELPPALAGTRCTLDRAATGIVSWYQAGPAGTDLAPLLLVHSVNAAGSAYEVRPLYEHYAATRPVYALDLPGFGFSERSARTYTPRLMTDAILAMAGHIATRHPGWRIDALALSLSSEFLARAACEAPALFRTAALVSPTGFSGASLRRGAPGSHLGRAGLLAVLNRRLWRRGLFALLTRPAVIRYFLRRTWGSPAIDTGLADYAWLTTRPPGAEHAPLHFLSGYLFSADSGTLYASLRIPVWASHGVRGDFVDYGALPELAAAARWRVEVFDTGALPHFEATDEFLRRYQAFLDAARG